MKQSKDIKGPDVSVFGMALAVRYRQTDVDIWECRLHQRNGLHIDSAASGFGTGGSRSRAFESAKLDLRENLKDGKV